MPVLDFRWDVDDIAGTQFLGGLAPLLVVAAPCRTQKNLAAVMVDMPIVPLETDTPMLLRGHR